MMEEVSKEIAERVCRELNDYLRQNGRTEMAYVYETDAFGVTLRTNVFDGDWKHDHLNWDWVAEEFFKNKGVGGSGVWINHTYVEDTGQDDGPAYHHCGIFGYVLDDMYGASKSARKHRVRKSEGKTAIEMLDSLRDVASYYDELVEKYGVPDNGNAWNDQIMLYDCFDEIRYCLVHLADQINDMRMGVGKRL